MRRTLLIGLVLFGTFQFVLLLLQARYPIAEHNALVTRVGGVAQEWHDACIMRLQGVGLSPRCEALAAGLLLGDRQMLASEDIHDVRSAGMSHLLAVSGLHVGIVWAVIWAVLSLTIPFVYRLGLNEYRYYEMLRLVSLTGVWIYVLLVGCPPSALRAGLMISVTQIAAFLHRDAWSWYNLAIAAFIMLLVSPSLIFSVGFQLSIAATAGILAFHPLLVPARSHPATHRLSFNVVLQYAGRLLALSLGAQIFTIPIVAYYFHFVPLLGWLQGLLVLPAVSFLMGGFIILILLPSSLSIIPVAGHSLMHWLSTPVELLTHYIFNFASSVSQAELWLVGGRAEWFPTVSEALCCELALIVAVVCWRVGYDRSSR